MSTLHCTSAGRTRPASTSVTSLEMTRDDALLTLIWSRRWGQLRQLDEGHKIDIDRLSTEQHTTRMKVINGTYYLFIPKAILDEVKRRIAETCVQTIPA